jgi:hypothetical protein
MAPHSSPVPLPKQEQLSPRLGDVTRWLWALARALESLWVCGLLLLQIVWVGGALPLSGKRWEWAQYLLLGVLFPALLLGACFVGRCLPRHDGKLTLIKVGLGAGCLLLIGFYFSAAAIEHVWPVWLFFVVTLLALWVVSPQCRPGSTSGGPPAYLPAGLLLSAVVVLAFSGWVPDPLPWIFGNAWHFGGLTLALLLSFCHLLRPLDGSRKATVLERAAHVAAVAAIVLLSFGWQRPCDWTAWHHWGAQAGPPEMVRQGGWLLWDTPSQYGFLCPLALASLPTDNVYESLYLVNGALISLTGIFLFALFRTTGRGWLNYWFSLALALATLLSIHLQWFLGPSNGPLRYGWCFALMALLWAAVRRPDPDDKPGRRLLVGGCFLWLLGSLWSFDSAVYVTAVWIPAFFVLVARRSLALEKSSSSKLRVARTAAAWLLLPPALLLTAAAGIEAWYRLWLGHGPDWYAYAEHALAFSGGFAARPISSHGPVWILLLVFGVIATILAACLARGARGVEVAAAAGALGLVWGTASYFVTRGGDGVFTVTIPMLVIALGVAVHLSLAGKSSAGVSLLPRISLAALLILIFPLAIIKLEYPATQEHLQPWARLPTLHIERYMPPLDPSVHGFLLSAGVQPDDPLVVFDGTDMLNPLRFYPDARGRTVPKRHPSWLPLPSPSVIIPLPPERVIAYMDRFLDRHPGGGWLLRRQGPSLTGILERLSRSHHVTRSIANAMWELSWYEPK